jgi:hypothetical protein
MFAPASARKLLVVKNRPALISVTRGLPSSSSFRSTQKTPVAPGSIAVTARDARSLTSARWTVRATEGVEPNALERELPAGEEFADHEVGERETARLDPVADPPDCLIARGDGQAGPRAGSPHRSNPGLLPAIEDRCGRLAEGVFGLGSLKTRRRQPGRGNACGKRRLVLAQGDRLCARQQCPSPDEVMAARKDEHLLLRLGVHDLDSLRVNERVQLVEVPRVVGWREEVAGVDRSQLEVKLARIAAHDVERLGCEP